MLPSTITFIAVIFAILAAGIGTWFWWCLGRGVSCNPLAAFSGYADEK